MIRPLLKSQKLFWQPAEQLQSGYPPIIKVIILKFTILSYGLVTSTKRVPFKKIKHYFSLILNPVMRGINFNHKCKLWELIHF